MPQMTKRRRRVLACCVSLGIIALMLLLAANWALRQRYETEDLVLAWANEGVPYAVTGRVVDSSGTPVPGVPVDLETDSGGNRVITDVDGRFSEDACSGDLIAIHIGSFEPIEPRWTIGLPLDKGLRLDITIKNERDNPPTE